MQCEKVDVYRARCVAVPCCSHTRIASLGRVWVPRVLFVERHVFLEHEVLRPPHAVHGAGAVGARAVRAFGAPLGLEVLLARRQ